MYGSTTRQLITVKDRSGEQTHYVTEPNGETSPLLTGGGGEPVTLDLVQPEGVLQLGSDFGEEPILPGQSSLSFHQVNIIEDFRFQHVLLKKLFYSIDFYNQLDPARLTNHKTERALPKIPETEIQTFTNIIPLRQPLHVK